MMVTQGRQSHKTVCHNDHHDHDDYDDYEKIIMAIMLITQGWQSHNTVCWKEKDFDQSNFKVETDLYNCHHIIILTITIVIIIILSLLQLSKGFQKRRKLPRPWER